MKFCMSKNVANVLSLFVALPLIPWQVYKKKTLSDNALKCIRRLESSF